VQESKVWVDAREAEFKKELRKAFPNLLWQRVEEFLQTHLQVIRWAAWFSQITSLRVTDCASCEL
jgi:hypothetical protein